MISAKVSPLPDALVGEFHPRFCVGVDIASGAPGKELVRVEVDPVHDVALREEALLAGLGVFEELVKVAREAICVGHHGENAGVAFLAVPADSDDGFHGGRPLPHDVATVPVA